MFKDNKLRLLMTLIGFTRLGEENDPDASWVVPSSLTAAELLESINLIRKFEFDPPTYEDGKTAQDFLRSKAAAARRSARKADFDDDSEGIDARSEEDRGEYALDAPTARNPSGKKILKRRRRERTPYELDDEEKDRRAAARREKELEKQRKVKSTIFVHDSDDESDEERDREFFEREQAIREKTMAQFRQSLALGSTEPASSRKRKGDGQPNKASKRRKTPPKKRRGPFDTDDSEDDDVVEAISVSNRASSEEAQGEMGTDDEDEATDTPLSSQHPAAAQPSEDEASSNRTSATSVKHRDIRMADADDDGDDEDDAVPVVRRPAARTLRAGFIVDSDSE
jgi:replication fork protection complex subunit Tof1/Swi1